MTVRHDDDLFKKIQSSYLWQTDDQWTHGSPVTAAKNLEDDVCEAVRSAVDPRFNAIIERARPTTTKEPSATSLSEMQFKSINSRDSREAWSPNPSQLPVIPEVKPSSKLVFIAKSGRQICSIRFCTIAFATFLFLLCATAIALPIGLTFTVSNSVVITTSTTSTTAFNVSTDNSTFTSSTSTTSTATQTAWIPINYYSACSSTCVNISTAASSSLLASWTFEENANDTSGNSNTGQIVNGASFVNGYIGQAINLQSSLGQYVNVRYINLANRSFTIEAWIYLNSLAPTGDLDIFGECEVTSQQDKCLHYVVRYNKVYLGFLSDDLSGATNLTTSTWYHVAFVHDNSINVKMVYLNGNLDGTSAASGATPSVSAFLGASGNVTIGSTAINTASCYWNGLLDQMSVTNRVKTSCEILNDASLVAHFSLDGSVVDSGPNAMTGTILAQGNSGMAWVTGRVNQALNFNSSNSYFQSCGFYAIGRNQPYSVAMWINPAFQAGTLFHVSSAETGSGAWCLPMIGFSSNGSIVGQSWHSSTVSVMGPILPINSWTHLVLTWSGTNGVQFYINGGLYGSGAMATYSASNRIMCVLIGTSGLGTNCQTGQISMGSFSGAIDELYIYNRELSVSEVCPLAHP